MNPSWILHGYFSSTAATPCFVLAQCFHFSLSSARALHLALLKCVQISFWAVAAQPGVEHRPASKFFQVLPVGSSRSLDLKPLSFGIVEDRWWHPAAQSSSILLKLPCFSRQRPSSRCSPQRNLMEKIRHAVGKIQQEETLDYNVGPPSVM